MKFEDLYIAWYARMKRFAKIYVDSDADAEDIVQEVFLNLYEKDKSLESYINITSYLFISVKNKSLDYIRNKIAKEEAIDVMYNEQLLLLKLNYDTLKDLDTEFFQPDSIEERLKKALDTLPPKCREIFIQNKFYGKKQKQIAEEAGISINTVETQMGIANKKLREELKDLIPLFLFLC